MAEALHPGLRRGDDAVARPRPRPRPVPVRARRLAIALLGIVALGIALLVLRGPPRIDPVRSLADARTAYRIGNYSAARNHALATLNAAPASPAAMLLLAQAYLALGDGVAAEGALRRANDLGLPARALAGLRARARFLQSDYTGAIDAAAAAAPDDGEAIRAAARATAMQGDAASGRQRLSGWLAGHPADAGGWTDLGRILLGGGAVADATAAAARATALAPGDPVALTLQAELVRTRYGPVAALPWFETALRRDAYFHPALIEYAATLGDAGRHAAMLSATRRALAARPGSPQALYLQAVLAARAGRIDLSRDLLARAGADIGDLAGAALLDGADDAARGRDERAIGRWRRLADDQPMNLVIRRLLAAALLRSGDTQGALDRLRPIALRDDADAYTLTLVARAFEAQGDRVAAARFLDRAAAGATATAAVFASDDDVGSTLADARDDPGDPNYLLGVIRAQAGAGDMAAAIATARRLALASPGAPAAQLALGDMLAVAGRYGEAAPVYARAANLAFDEPTMLRLVDAQGRAGLRAAAAATLSLYLRQNPQSLVALRILGHWQLLGGQADAAIGTLERVRRLAGSRDAAVLADLAAAYAARDDGGTALRYVRAAYSLAPMNAAVCDAYAVALAASGEIDGARQLAAKALALAPGDGRIVAHAAAIRR